MIFSKYLALVISGALLVACSQDSEQVAAPSPAEPLAWIDMPLSENTWWPADREFRTGTYQIVLDAFAALEFKIGMNAGDMIVYEWNAGNLEPEMLLSEFHGHTERQGDEPGNLMFYSNHTKGSERGALLAPFSGIHGWYLKNNRLDEVVVTLRVAGFYEEVEQ
jgi:hypothetical protein